MFSKARRIVPALIVAILVSAPGSSDSGSDSAANPGPPLRKGQQVWAYPSYLSDAKPVLITVDHSSMPINGTIFVKGTDNKSDYLVPAAQLNSAVVTQVSPVRDSSPTSPDCKAMNDRLSDAAENLVIHNAASGSSPNPSSGDPQPTVPSAPSVPGVPQPPSVIFQGAPQAPILTGPVEQTSEQAYEIAQRAEGQALIDSATQKMHAIAEAASDDYRALRDAYKDLGVGEMAGALNRAANRIQNTLDALNESTASSLSEGDRQIASMAYQTAQQQAIAGAELFSALNEKQNLNQVNLFVQLKDNPYQNPFAKTPALATLFGNDEASLAGNSQQNLANRILDYNGLPAAQQAQFASQLQLAEKSTFTLPNGESQTINILHNGYIFGAGKTGIDCSSFVSSIIDSAGRKSLFTTLDFYQMWNYARFGRFPRPPQYTLAREKLVKKAALAFSAVDLYQNEMPRVGDLLVFRTIWSPVGHVFLVKSMNLDALKVTVIEAAQSAGTVRERDFDLAFTVPNSGQRFIRPGLFVLRLKPRDNSACNYKK